MAQKKKKNTRWVYVLLVAVASVALFLFFLKHIFVQPDLSLQKLSVYDLENKPVRITEFIGKPLIVDMWATWCPPCRESLPHWENLKSKYSNQIEILLVSSEDQATIEHFKLGHNYDLLYYLRSNISLSDLGVYMLPTTYFYNAKGELVFKHTGGVDEATAEALVQKIL